MSNFFHRVWRIVSYPFRALWWLVLLPSRVVKRIHRFLTFEPEDRPLAEALSTISQHPMAIFEHIEVLRRHLFRMLLAVAGGIAICAAFTPQIINFLAASIGGLESLQAIDVTESVGVFMRVALLGGFALALPYLAFESWLFAAPGLHARARQLGLLSIPLALIFFVCGMAFAYWLIFPAALPFLLNFMGVHTVPRLSSYISFVTGLLFWIGLAFEFPLIIYILTLMGILKPRSLLRHWRIAIVAIAVLAAAITPTVDPVNMTLVMAPMVALFFLSIGLSFIASIRRSRHEVD